MDAIVDLLNPGTGNVRWLYALIIVVLTALLARWVDHRMTDAVIRRASVRLHEDEKPLVRAKRLRTAATLASSVGRYGVVVLGGSLALVLAAGDVLDTPLGRTVMVVIIGFVMQRVLLDMISGALLLFEGQIAVGDYIKTTQLDGISGIVERVGLRSTTLRSFNGDQHVVLNGSLQGFSRVRNGWCDFELELFTVNDADAEEAVQIVCKRMREFEQNFFLRGPALVEARGVGERDVRHLRVRAIVPPTLEWLCESALPRQIESELGDLLLGDVQVFNLDERSFAQYRAAVVLPARIEASPPRATRRLEEQLNQAPRPRRWSDRSDRSSRRRSE